MPKTTPRRRKSANPFLDAAESLIESFARSLVQNSPARHYEFFCPQCRATFLVNSPDLSKASFCPKCGVNVSFCLPTAGPQAGPPHPKPHENDRQSAIIWLAREAGVLDYIASDDAILDRTIKQAIKRLRARNARPEEFLRLEECVETIRKK